VLTVLLTLLGVPVAASALYLLALAVASAFHRPRAARPVPSSRLVVLVPAHNEAELIARCVASLRKQRYPSQLYRIVVVADNCSDQTAAIARSAGADVLIRHQPSAPGKGHALAWAIGHVFSDPIVPDAIVVVDADAVAASDFLLQLEAELAAGHESVQANDLILTEPGSLRSALEAAVLLLRNGVRFAGRAVLGLPATLCGNGMLLSRQVLDRHPWSAFTATEDTEYSIRLRMAGVRTAFAHGARIYAAATAGEAGAHTQGLRWEAGRFRMARQWLLPMLGGALRDGRLDLLMDVVDMLVPAFTVLATLAVAGAGMSGVLIISGAATPAAFLPWLIGLLALPVYVFIGLRAAHAPATCFAALLLLAPRFALRKAKIYAHLLSQGEMPGWVRTARPAEARGRS
jgi:hypothetical protein